MVDHAQEFAPRWGLPPVLIRRCGEYLFAFLLIFLLLLVAHAPLLHLPYFWDEAGYYVPAAYDFYKHFLLVPRITLANGHVPLVMIYLGLVWHLFGFSQTVTRMAMILIASLTVFTTYVMGEQLQGRETGAWAAALLALSPLFFAQSSLVLIDLPATLFTSLSLFFTLARRWFLVAVALSLAVLSKETAIIVIPVIWAFMYFRARERRAGIWLLSLAPIGLLLLWSLYYHSKTGFWVGNAKYLQYNLFSALTPFHVTGSLLARIAEITVQGFKWTLSGAAVAGIWWQCRKQPIYGQSLRSTSPKFEFDFRDYLFTALGTIGIYAVALSVVGGAILPRYMLPVFPVLYVLFVVLIRGLPLRVSRLCFLAAIVFFIGSWFINAPYPNFPYEDNLAYASFVGLHQSASKFLEHLPGSPLVLTAWPATDELTEPYLGYVNRPLRVSSLQDFTSSAFANPPRFDVLYLYSRRWEPAANFVGRSPLLRTIANHLYNYEPPEPADALVVRFHLRLLGHFQDRGQWVKLYAAPSYDDPAAGEKHR